MLVRQDNVHTTTWRVRAWVIKCSSVGVGGGGAPLADALLRVSGVGNCEWDSSDMGDRKNDLIDYDSKVDFTWGQAQMMS